MKRIVWTFGLIAGSVFVAEMAAMVPLMRRTGKHFENGYLIGYSTMVIAFIMVFVGIRTYRENTGGAITFGKAFKVGLLITLIASAMYVVSWEVVYYGFIPDFGDKYAAYTIEAARAKGASPEELAATRKSMEDMKRWMRNPLINAGMTLMEVLPVGLVITLLSAAVLRKRSTGFQPTATAAVT